MMDINVASDLSGEEIRIVEKIMDYVETHKKHLVLDGAEKETYRYEDGTIAVEYHLGTEFSFELGKVKIAVSIFLVLAQRTASRFFDTFKYIFHPV